MAEHRRTHTWEEAVRSLGIEPRPRIRPDPLHWLWYAFWGPLPPRYRTWVLYDATCATWVIRHVLRLLTVAAVPIAALVLLLPGPGQLRALTAVVAGLCALFCTVVWINEATDDRLAQAGWPEGTGPAVRERRGVVTRWSATVRRL